MWSGLSLRSCARRHDRQQTASAQNRETQLREKHGPPGMPRLRGAKRDWFHWPRASSAEHPWFNLALSGAPAIMANHRHRSS